MAQTCRSCSEPRGWTDDEFADGRAELVDRGWLDLSGELTAVGRAAQRDFEADTDRLAATPWLALGDERTAELATLLRPIAHRVMAGADESMLAGLGSPWPPPD